MKWQVDYAQTDGVDALAAFKQLGMDAAIHCSRATEPLCFSNADGEVSGTREWREEIEVIESTPNGKLLLHTIHTPEGSLTCKTRSNQITIWVSEGLIKRHEDVDLIEKYMPCRPKTHTHCNLLSKYAVQGCEVEVSRPVTGHFKTGHRGALQGRLALEYQERIQYLPLETLVERGLTCARPGLRDHLEEFHRRYLDFGQMAHL